MRKKPPSPIRVGMMADDLLKMRGRSKDHMPSLPVWIKYQEIAAWTYEDCTVILQRRGDEGPYRVDAVVPVRETG